MGQARARRWLARHGPAGRDATPLLRARLDARRRGEMVSWVLVVAATAAYLVAAGLSDVSGRDPASLYRIGAFYAAMALAAIVALWVQGRAERRVARALTRRVAHPQAVRVRVVVGRWFVVATALTFGAGALAGLAAAAAAADPGDRALGLILLGALGVFALIGLAGLVQVVRRPAIADDEQSLLDDLVLRREDALRVVLPYPALLALVAGAQSRSLSMLFVFLGYAVVAGVAWSLAYAVATHATTGRPAAGTVTA